MISGVHVLTARHWVDKNCLPWSKDYFATNVANTSVEAGDHIIVITSVDSVTGDCDVTQRKGKCLCIYDMKLQFTVSVTVGDDTKTTTITIPEFVHDQDEDEYVFDVSGDHIVEVKKHLVPVLRTKLMKFQGDLIAAHEKDVQHASG